MMLSSMSLQDFDLLSLGASTLLNPYPFFRKLRAEAPVYREQRHGVYLVSKYDDIVAASRATNVFSSFNAIVGPFVPLPVPVDELQAYRDSTHGVDKLFSNDPPEHTRFRQLVASLFTTKRVSHLEDRIREHVAMLLADLGPQGEIEVVRKLSNVLPLLTVGEVLGVSPEDNARFLPYFTQHFDEMESFVGKPDAPISRLPWADLLEDYFSTELARRRASPQGDVMTELANARFANGEEVPFEEVVRLCTFLYTAGGDANTPQLITNGTKILAENRNLFLQLQANPSLIDQFVDETLRIENSNLGLFRLVRCHTQIRDVSIQKGEYVMLLYASGNHDEQYFDEPEEFRLDRPKRRVLSFGGFGPHTCPGASLARLEARVTFQELLKRWSGMSLVSKQHEIRWIESCILRAPRELRIRYC